MLLEKRVGVLESSLEMKDAQLGEVLAAAHLDPTTLQQVRVGRATQVCISLPGCMLQCTMQVVQVMCTAHLLGWLVTWQAKWLLLLLMWLQVNKKLEEVLTSKNSIIRALQYDVAKVVDLAIRRCILVDSSCCLLNVHGRRRVCCGVPSVANNAFMAHHVTQLCIAAPGRAAKLLRCFHQQLMNCHCSAWDRCCVAGIQGSQRPHPCV